jgi:hypothetical protein
MLGVFVLNSGGENRIFWEGLCGMPIGFQGNAVNGGIGQWQLFKFSICLDFGKVFHP